MRVANPLTELNPGWKNLQFVEEGEIVGRCGDEVIRAPQAGAMVFPQYKKDLKIGQSLFHLLTPIQIQDLP